MLRGRDTGSTSQASKFPVSQLLVFVFNMADNELECDDFVLHFKDDKRQEKFDFRSKRLKHT